MQYEKEKSRKKEIIEKGRKISKRDEMGIDALRNKAFDEQQAAQTE